MTVWWPVHTRYVLLNLLLNHMRTYEENHRGNVFCHISIRSPVRKHLLYTPNLQWMIWLHMSRLMYVCVCLSVKLLSPRRTVVVWCTRFTKQHLLNVSVIQTLSHISEIICNFYRTEILNLLCTGAYNPIKTCVLLMSPVLFCNTVTLQRHTSKTQ